MNNDNKEVIEAISALSSHVDTQINGVKEEINGVKEEIGNIKADMGKLRSDLIEHVTRTVGNISLAVKDQRVDKTVYKLKEKNVFNSADVLEVLSPVSQA